MSAPTVLFWVQHLLGTGHLKRAGLIAQALRARGLRPLLILGGAPVPGLIPDDVEQIELPPIRTADAQFSALVRADGAPLDTEIWQKRRAMLHALLDTARPAALITEMYPFARRAFRHELRPWLDAARQRAPRPIIACSVRDVLVHKAKPERYAETRDVALACYDLVLVHGDPAFVPFRATFPHSEALGARLIETGFVTDTVPLPVVPDDARCGVLVSVGGGAVGLPLLHAALAARRAGLLTGEPWTLLTGQGLAEAAFAALRAEAPQGVTVRRFDPDLPQRMAEARLSISQAGYNTVLDVLRARVPAVLVPFGVGGESEQRQRAKILAARGLATVLPPESLDLARLAAACRKALTHPPSASLTPLRLDGAARTASILAERIETSWSSAPQGRPASG